MPEVKLGTKYTCYSCGIKFYDLGRGGPICPKCGADQNDADEGAGAAASQAARRKRKPESKVKAVKKAVDEELDGEELEGGEIDDDLGDDDLPTDLSPVLDEEEAEDDDEEVGD